jgi:hypothetical protein
MIWSRDGEIHQRRHGISTRENGCVVCVGHLRGYCNHLTTAPVVEASCCAQLIARSQMAANSYNGHAVKSEKR